MSEVEYDFSDPMIRGMVDINHMPQEIWSPGQLLAIRCARCEQQWPCKPRQQLRRWESAQAEAHVETTGMALAARWITGKGARDPR